MVFELNDQGKMFLYDVWLRGEDKSGSDELMCNFSFAGFDKRQITAPTSKFAASVKRPIIAAEVVPVTVLNEDPGVNPPPDDPEALPIGMPHRDEIFARVQLYRVGTLGLIKPVANSRSATQTFLQ